MKKLIILFAILFAFANCFSQTQLTKISIKEAGSKVPKGNTYIENEYLNKFVGSWQWEKGDKKLTVTFTKNDQTTRLADGPLIIQAIKGDYQLYENKQKVSLDSKKYNLYGTTESDTDPVLFRIPKNNKFTFTYLELVYIDKNTLQLRMNRHHENNGPDDPDFKFPKDITLKRVE